MNLLRSREAYKWFKSFFPITPQFSVFFYLYKLVGPIFKLLKENPFFIIFKRKKRRYFFRYKKPVYIRKFSIRYIYEIIIKNTHFYFLYYFLFNHKNFFSATYLKQDLKIFLKIRSKFITKKCLWIFKSVWREGFLYLRALLIIFVVDATFTDDEPLWEPIEWSLVLTWLLFIFIFAWIAENLVTSRYGSYTGRDKRVWFGWYKTFWLLEAWFAISYGIASLFVIVPFYSELVYPVAFTFSWWHWYSRIFFFKFIFLYSILLLLAYYLQLNIKWLNWKKAIIFILVINFFLAYLIYTHVIMLLFSYFTDPLWYQKTKYIDYVQLSHEPWKWGWGPVKRDHFSYHKVSTVFWFKNDGPYAGAFLLIHMFFLISLFLLNMYWLVLLRRVFATKELTITFFVFCVSALKQFFIFFFMFYILVLISFIGNYWTFPIEFLWLTNTSNVGKHFFFILIDYPFFLFSIFF